MRRMSLFKMLEHRDQSNQKNLIYNLIIEMNMAFYGVGLEVKVKDFLLQVQMQIQNKPGRDIRYSKVIFKRYDANIKGKLDSKEFEY